MTDNQRHNIKAIRRSFRGKTTKEIRVQKIFLRCGPMWGGIVLMLEEVERTEPVKD